jgi:hypothetical protein
MPFGAKPAARPKIHFGSSIVAFLGLVLGFYGRYFIAVVALGLVLALGIWVTSSAARWLQGRPGSLPPAGQDERSE